MNKLFKSAAVACLLASAPLAASAVTIDFEGLDSSSGQTLLTSFSEDGFSFDVSFTRTTGRAVSGVAVFDSANPVNGDTDLSPVNQGDNGVEGNILILQEAGSNVPDDAAAAGTITLTLTAGSAFNFLGASAIDNTDFTFSSIIGGLTTELGNIDIGNIEGNQVGGTGQLTFATASALIGIGDSIFIELGGSGGIDSLVLDVPVSAVPVPAALPLMLVAMGGFGVMSRRRKKHTA